VTVLFGHWVTFLLCGGLTLLLRNSPSQGSKK
jgi:hypothetical protein